MKDNLDYSKLFSASSITLRILEAQLNEKNIHTLLKDNQESGRLAGFGTTGNINELFVFNKDLEQAKEILEKFKQENVK